MKNKLLYISNRSFSNCSVKWTPWTGNSKNLQSSNSDKKDWSLYFLFYVINYLEIISTYEVRAQELSKMECLRERVREPIFISIWDWYFRYTSAKEVLNKKDTAFPGIKHLRNQNKKYNTVTPCIKSNIGILAFQKN